MNARGYPSGRSALRGVTPRRNIMTRVETSDIAVHSNFPSEEKGPPIVVLKFGGTSLGTSSRIGLAALRVKEQIALGFLPTHTSMDCTARECAGIGDSLLRLSVGIEHADDLVADITCALDAIPGAAIPY